MKIQRAKVPGGRVVHIRGLVASGLSVCDQHLWANRAGRIFQATDTKEAVTCKHCQRWILSLLAQLHGALPEGVLSHE